MPSPHRDKVDYRGMIARSIRFSSKRNETRNMFPPRTRHRTDDGRWDMDQHTTQKRPIMSSVSLEIQIFFLTSRGTMRSMNDESTIFSVRQTRQLSRAVLTSPPATSQPRCTRTQHGHAVSWLAGIPLTADAPAVLTSLHSSHSSALAAGGCAWNAQLLPSSRLKHPSFLKRGQSFERLGNSVLQHFHCCGSPRTLAR
jgi:hypothetical protein